MKQNLIEELQDNMSASSFLETFPYIAVSIFAGNLSLLLATVGYNNNFLFIACSRCCDCGSRLYAVSQLDKNRLGLSARVAGTNLHTVQH